MDAPHVVLPLDSTLTYPAGTTYRFVFHDEELRMERRFESTDYATASAFADGQCDLRNFLLVADVLMPLDLYLAFNREPRALEAA